MRLASFAVVLLLTAPACADRASEDALLAKARSTYLNDPAMEKAAIAASPKRATRTGATLRLERIGRPLTLTDTRAACDDDSPRFDAGTCARYDLVADLRTRHAYLVVKGGYEGCGDLLLIDDRSGRQTLFADVPTFSPDGERLLIQNECEAEGSASDNHLEIWRRQADGWVLEWAYTDEAAYAADPDLKRIFHSTVVAWQGDRIVLAFSDSDAGRHWTGSLTRIEGRWVLKAGKLQSP